MSKKETLTQSIIELNEQQANQIIQEMIAEQTVLEEVIEACRDGMTVVGDLFEKGEYFLSELIMAGELLKGIMVHIKANLNRDPSQLLETVLIGTVEGDIHNIGKDIVINVLEANGYRVIDLGIDVSSDKFVEAIKDHNPQVVGLSGLLTEAIQPMKNTVEAIKTAGLRDQVMVIIGGGVVNEEVMQYVGADKWSNNVSTGLKGIKEWVGGRNA